MNEIPSLPELGKLMQIQELEFVIKESEIVHRGAGEALNGLRTQIEVLRRTVPVKVLGHFDRVRKNGVGIAFEEGGRCRACHMVIPVGTITRIKGGGTVPICPHCNVFVILETFKGKIQDV